MADPSSCVQTLCSGGGEKAGVFIPFELWSEVEAEVLPLVQRVWERKYGGQEQAEPIGDWDMLVNNWDFTYPVEMDLSCGHCGQSTPNWREDVPRKFRLKAASLGGLVAFECQACRSRVTKRHFKDGIRVETTPRQS